ncbi:response regulator transcription factor [Amycolatopsis sp. H20-H5]|uniref:response regulator transcription factor n=1 Tax=Amycolatopsis sp. H20-H5 TaxID=3046309 RepID=UPI002DBDB042|nr:response regulator transcription factor [Amycolatopsis sp. H20-H5]MEC3976817.1 response regulator transcription factor [Amycolatopsis sp. H20-H5]
MIRLVLVEDEQLTREAVGALLGLEGDLEVVGEAASGEEALATVRAQRPDVVVLDVDLPGMDGAEIAERIAAEWPGIRCVMLTRHARPGVLRRALSVGAAGFVAKSAPAALLATAIRRVHAGGRYVDAELAMTALNTEGCPLTDRELEVLRQVRDARTASDIADLVHLSAGTVRNYLSSAMRKLGANTRSEAVRRARDNGWL